MKAYTTKSNYSSHCSTAAATTSVHIRQNMDTAILAVSIIIRLCEE